ncbi:uncharacterized protein [Asterias amurensis]|uniref:uncharacterized protein n=1 Tax=Asterias amurensis TaxID=7602 RepID=UPI003AB8576B
MASCKNSNWTRRLLVDKLNGIRTALYSNAHLALEMSSFSHPNHQLDPRLAQAASPSLTEKRSVFKSSADDEECMSTTHSHLNSGSIICSSSSYGGTLDCPMSLSSDCGELTSTLNSVDNVSPELLPQSSYTVCSSHQLTSQSVLPLSSACGTVTLSRETQNQTGQLEESEKSIQLELSEFSFASREVGLSQSADSHGTSCMENHGCSVQIKVEEMEEPVNSASLTSDNLEQSTILSDRSHPFLSGTQQQFNTEKSCKANDIRELPTNHGCAGKSSVDTNDQGLFGSKETNDQYQGSALSNKETNDQCQGSSLFSSEETNDQCRSSAMSSTASKKQCQRFETNGQCRISAMRSKETNDQCRGSALSSKETNDQHQVPASSTKETNNDQCQAPTSYSKETNDQCQVPASCSKETNDQCQLYNFVIFSHDDDADKADCIFRFLEDKHLRGFKNGRDDTPGTFKSDELVKSIKNTEKILLLLTPKSIHDENFKFVLNLSLTHSIERRSTSLIPICLGIQRFQVPETLRSKCCIHYNDFGDKFKDRLFRVFRSTCRSSSTSSVSFDSQSSSPSSIMESESSTKSSDSPKLKKSHSMPSSSSPNRPWYTPISRFFSSHK